MADIEQNSPLHLAALHRVSSKIVKLRRGSGRGRQGMAVKAKGLKA